MKTFSLLLVFGFVFGTLVPAEAQAQPTASDVLKRAGLLPDAKATPPTLSKDEGELVRVSFGT
jgi:hypothetical protein